MNNLSSQIFREIGALSRMIQNMSDVAFKKYDPQKGQFMYITRICENPGINHIRLSQLIHVDKGTTTKAIQKLVKNGYIEKRRDKKDYRIQRLYPTQSIVRVYNELIEKEEEFISQSFSGFSAVEKKKTTELIKKMRANIESEWMTLKNMESITNDS